MNTNTRIRLGFRSLIRVGGSGKQVATGGTVEAGTAGAGTRTLMICPLFSAITRFNYFFFIGGGIVRLPLRKGPSKVNWNTSQSAGTLTFSSLLLAKALPFFPPKLQSFKQAVVIGTFILKPSIGIVVKQAKPARPSPSRTRALYSPKHQVAQHP